jgi:hypothetical protein
MMVSFHNNIGIHCNAAGPDSISRFTVCSTSSIAHLLFPEIQEREVQKMRETGVGIWLNAAGRRRLAAEAAEGIKPFCDAVILSKSRCRRADC